MGPSTAGLDHSPPALINFGWGSDWGRSCGSIQSIDVTITKTPLTTRMGVFTSTVKSLDSGFEAIGGRISFERVVLYSGFESIGGRISFERAVNGEYLRSEGKRMDGWMQQ